MGNWFGGNNDRTVVQTQNSSSEPWDAAQPFLRDVISKSQTGFSNGDFKIEPFSGSSVIPFSEQTQQSMDTLEQIGSSGNPIFSNALSGANDIIAGGGQQEGQGQAFDAFSRVADGGYRPEAAAGISGMLDTASGAYLNGSPELDNVISRASNDVREQIDESFNSAGRTFSGQHAATIADRIGDLSSNIRLQNYNMERGNQVNAHGQLVGAAQGQDAQALGAAQGLNNAYRGATADMLTAGGMAPDLFAAQTLPADVLRQVGSDYEGQASRELQDEMNRHYAEQSAEFDALSRAMALAGGAGQMGGTTSGTVLSPDQSPSTFERILGAGAYGLGAFGGFGGF